MGIVDTDKYPDMKLFTGIGIQFEDEDTDQYIAMCPFCDGDKLFIDPETTKWDCKHCGEVGNGILMLRTIYNQAYENRKQPGPTTKLRQAAKLRGLPLVAFRLAKAVINPLTDEVWLPIFDLDGRLQTIRYWDGKSLRALGGLGTRPWNLQNFTPKKDKHGKPNKTVYMCEGEFDGIALQWLLKQVDHRACVLALPGASNFKQKYHALLSGWRVVWCFDNDKAGQAGVKKHTKVFASLASSQEILRWPDDPDEYPDKFDVNDYVRIGLSEGYAPPVIWQGLHKKFEVYTPKEGEKSDDKTEVQRKRPATNASLAETFMVFRRELDWHEGLDDTLRLTFAVVLASQVRDNEPLWMFFEGPPGCGKTTILDSLQGLGECMHVSQFRKTDLVTGFQPASGRDPSLIPQFSRAGVLVVKDFTEILAMQRNERDEVFAILRGAYDGHVFRNYANGVVRDYDRESCYFNMLAATTKKIQEEAALSAAFGERFIKYVIRVPRRIDPYKVARYTTVQLHDRLQNAALAFLDRDVPREFGRVDLPGKYLDSLYPLCEFCALVRMHAVWSRKGANWILSYQPEPESAARLFRQLLALTKALCFMEGQRQPSVEIWRLICKVGLSTVLHPRNWMLMRLIEADHASLADLLGMRSMRWLRMSSDTVRSALEDLVACDLADVTVDDDADGRRRQFFTPGKHVLQLLRASDLPSGVLGYVYGTMDERNHQPRSQSRRGLRVRRKRR